MCTCNIWTVCKQLLKDGFLKNKKTNFQMPSHRRRRMLAAVYHMRVRVFYATGNRLIPTSCLDA